MTVPIISAQIVCNSLVQAGINGIMSFAPVVLTVPEHVAVNYVNLCNELEATSFTAMTKSKLKYFRVGVEVFYANCHVPLKAMTSLLRT